MAATDILAADIRNRLGADSTDITTDQATQFIAYANGWESKILAINSKAVATLETYEAAIVKQAKIDKAALMALSGIALNTDEFTVAVIKVKGLSEKNIKSLMETLQESIDKSFELLGWVQYTLTSRAIGGNDYTPGGEENTMIDFGEVESDTPFRTMT